MLKKCLFGFSMILVFVVAASAQTDWNGFYVGGNIGSVLGRSTANTSTAFSQSAYFTASSVADITINGRQKLSGNAFTGGLETGVNAQSGTTVVGGELDFQSMRLNDGLSTTSPYSCCAGSFTIDQFFKTRWLLTARPKVGVAMGSALVYATAGLAVTKINYEAVFTDTSNNASEDAFVDKRKFGWVGGFGIAYRVPNEHFSVKGEYLYTDFGNLTMTSSNLTAFTPREAFPGNVFTHTIGLHGHTLRAGFDYHW